MEKTDGKRKQAAEILRASEERFRNILQSIPSVAVQGYGPDGTTQYWNRASEKLYGYSAQEAVGRNLLDLIIPPEMRREVSKAIQHMTETGQAIQASELNLMRKDGSRVAVFSSHAVVQRPGRLPELFCLDIDLTDVKRAEAALRKSEDWLRSVFRVAPVGIGVVKNRVLLDANPRFCEMVGYTRKELVGKSVRIFFPSQEEFEYVGREKYRQIAEMGTGELETRFRTKDGSVIDVLLASTPMNLQDLSAGVTFSALDITERKQMESALMASENRFRKLVETISDVIFEIDEQGNINYVSPVGLEIWGGDPGELIGRSFIEVVHPEDRNRLIVRFEELRHGVERAETYRFVNRAGHVIWVRTRTTPIIEEGIFKGARGTLSDITALKQAEEERHKLGKQLMQAQKLESIGTLAGGIAHDFNNILFPLMGFAEILKEELPEDSPLQGHIDEILHAALRSKDLVKQILALSRKGEQSAKRIQLHPIVKEALKLIRSTVPTIIDIQQDIDSDCGHVQADPTQVHQIVMNLATNAYHAMEEAGGRLHVSLKQVVLASESVPSVLQALAPGKYALLVVSDTGAGMEKGVLDKIFDPYFTTKGVGKGTGLGLSVVQGIVQSHRGEICVSSAPGKGTEVRVYLPIMEQPAEEMRIKDSKPLRGGAEKILLVDDEEAIVRLEKQILERRGYYVEKYTSSVEALAAFRANSNAFDLVLTDMMMPDMTGIALSEALISIRPDIPIVIFTGFSEKISDEKAKLIGIKGLLMKPVVKSDMVHMVRKVLDEAKE